MRAMLMLGMTLACVGGTAGAATMAGEGGAREAAVPMSVRGVGQYQGSSVVLLEDATGTRRLPIWIGDLEAGAIDMRVKKVERVEVVDLRDNVYYGRLTLRDAKGTTRTIDARPSDCIALAVGAGLPIFVAPSVLRAAAEAP